jgi:hypothetical protein
VVDRFLDQHAELRLEALQAEVALAIWDESEMEKPASTALAGMGPVRSTKATRRKRIQPVVYNPLSGWPVTQHLWSGQVRKHIFLLRLRGKRTLRPFGPHL